MLQLPLQQEYLVLTQFLVRLHQLAVAVVVVIPIQEPLVFLVVQAVVVLYCKIIVKLLLLLELLIKALLAV